MPGHKSRNPVAILGWMGASCGLAQCDKQSAMKGVGV